MTTYTTATGQVTRLTITPDRVTVKVPKDYDDRSKHRLETFVKYVLEQFVSPIKEDWRGEIKFELDGVHWASVVLRSGNKTRSYQAII